MAADDRPLTDAERAELEELRAEKAAREQAARNRAEHAELERLRAERDRQSGKGQRKAAPRPKAQTAPKAAPQRRAQPAAAAETAPQQARTRRTRAVTPEEAAQIEHDREVRARNAKLMEPDDDLNMPIGQKVALVAIFAFAIIAVLAIVLGPK